MWPGMSGTIGRFHTIRRRAATMARATPSRSRAHYRVSTTAGTIECRTVFDHYAALCAKYSPEVVEATCWIPQAQLEEAARLIWHARPVSYYAWSGHEQHANTTETARAMALLYALTGSFDAPGGNVLLPAIAVGADHRRGSAGRKADAARDRRRRTPARPRALERRIDALISTARCSKACPIRCVA